MNGDPLTDERVDNMIQAMRIKLRLLPVGHEDIAPLRLRLADSLLSQRYCKLALEECRCLLLPPVAWLNPVRALLQKHLSEYANQNDTDSALRLRSLVCSEMPDLLVECCS